MENHIEELKNKLHGFKNMTYSFHHAYNDISFKIFIQDFEKIFDDYEFPDNSYLNELNMVENLRTIANMDTDIDKYR